MTLNTSTTDSYIMGLNALDVTVKTKLQILVTQL